MTAKEIQTEMLSAQEALLKEANDVLEQAKNMAGYEDRLEAMGFSGSAESLKRKKDAAKELDRLRDMYSFEYPGLKFIPRSVMGDICKKYGLAIGHVRRYLGEVPEWALKIIEANKRHIQYMDEYDSETHRDAALKMLRERKASSGRHQVVFAEHYIPMGDTWMAHNGTAFIGGDDGWQGTMMGSGIIANKEDLVPIELGMVKRSNLFIAAPRHEMRVEHNEEVLKDGTIVQVAPALDPIVCLSVEGGYIVLAAWGEEGQDTRVFNQQNN